MNFQLRPGVLFLLLLTACWQLPVSKVRAQQFGGSPAKRWNQLSNPAVRVIFPPGLDSTAMRIADLMQYLNQNSKSIGYKQKQINLVLQNQTLISNAYVGIGPFRSEFFLTAPQNSFELGSLPWSEQLAIHEYRHVQQYNNFNVGLSRGIRILFGEQGQGLANGAAIPDWLFEGDAVYNETLYSQQGRGRLPYFFNGYRSLWRAGKDYNWMKLRNGSFRDYVPSHYPLGYMLVAYGRNKYGEEFWKNVTHDAAAYKGVFYPFQKAVKTYANASFPNFRQDALNYFKKELAADNKDKSAKHFDADLEYPAFIDDSTLIYSKSSYHKVPVWMIGDGKNEKQLANRGASLDNYFSYQSGKVVYAAYRSDVRRAYRNFSELTLLDVGTGKKTRLTKRTKYFSPAISQDGTTIVAVNQDLQNHALHLISTIDGHVKKVLPNPDRLFFTYPKLSDKGFIISPVRNNQGQMALAKLDTRDGKTTLLSPFSFQVIGVPAIEGDTVYFTASYKKNDGLFALSLSDQQLYQLESDSLNAALGNYQPAVNNQSLAWTSFAADGFRLHISSLEDLRWIKTNLVDIADKPDDFGIESLNERVIPWLPAIEPLDYKITTYKKATKLFNFHTLDPQIDDPNYSLTLLGNNVLNTFQSAVKGLYNRNEQYKQLSATVIFGDWFPFLTAAASYTFDRRQTINNNRIYWDEWQWQGGLFVPFNLSAGTQITSLNLGAHYVYAQTSLKRPNSVGIAYDYLNTNLSFYNRALKAKQHIYPRYGQNFSVNFKHALSRYKAEVLLLRTDFTFPGLFSNHGWLLSGAFQQKNKGSQISFSNNFPFSRGYGAENLYRLDKWSLSYFFPIAYPDAGFANIAYLLRLRSNLFYDHTRAVDFYSSGNTFRANFRSAGAELFFDGKLWNQLPVTLGLRYSHLLDKDVFGNSGSNRFEIVLPLNLF
jgi:hypothetical protein